MKFVLSIFLLLILSTSESSYGKDKEPCDRNKSCSAQAIRCEKGCEVKNQSPSCFEACDRDYQECTKKGGATDSEIPDCKYPKIPCQTGTNTYVCKLSKDC